MPLPQSDPADSVPEGVLDAAKAAFEHRLTEDLAVLVYDSLVDGDDPPEDHFLRFEHAGTAITVQVASGPTGVGLSGSVSPPASGSFEVAIEGSSLAFRQQSTDGSFTFDPIGHGLVRITFEPAGAKPLSTDWFRI